MFGVGIWEVIIIVFVIVLLFGANRLPELGSALGEGIKNFRKAYRESKALDVSSSPSDASPTANENQKSVDSRQNR